MIKRLTELFPSVLLEELQRVGRDVVRITPLEYPRYECRETHGSKLLRRICPKASDLCSMHALANLIAGGPKLVRVSKSQQKAMRQVAVELELHDVELPYQTVLVELDAPPFVACLMHRYDREVLVLYLVTRDHSDEITTMIRHQDGVHVEDSLSVVENEVKHQLRDSLAAQRVALNVCLMLVDEGWGEQFALPKEVERDLRLGDERATKRLGQAVTVLSFEQDVVFARHERGESTPDGHEVAPHWRRGHWCMQPYGPDSTLRKRIFRRPVLVRSDLFAGAPSQTSTSYR